jgi:hypothetical protein
MPYAIFDKQVIITTDGTVPTRTGDLVATKLFRDFIGMFIEHLVKYDSEFLSLFPDGLGREEQAKELIELLSTLTDRRREELLGVSKWRSFLADTYALHQMVEHLYNYWRAHERYLVCFDGETKHLRPYRTFKESVESLNHLVRSTYRRICQNITGKHPRIYRQVATGAQIGLIVHNPAKGLPACCEQFNDVALIRQVLIEPPLIIDPPTNKRAGQFNKVAQNPLAGLAPKKKEWFCYPAKVGDLLVYVYFHHSFIGLGSSLANLFDLAEDEDLTRQPDAVYAFGVPEDKGLQFYEDPESGMLVAAVPRGKTYAYFGYLKKMILTLHNAIMIRRGHLPVHGAMTRITPKRGQSVNIVVMGDTGTGKSESLEAFRTLSEGRIRTMTVVFDDMGSLREVDGEILAYGTETGAFVRLDDLSPGYAFGAIDRSIIMSPQKTNARAVIPITTIEEVLRGHPLDYFLYANNYEPVEDGKPYFEPFDTPEAAFKVFRKGARMAKGTTVETGLVKAYFANIFGPPAYKEEHDAIAKRFFEKLFSSGVRVGQLRTQLGVPGMETEGPRAAANALLEMITSQ